MSIALLASLSSCAPATGMIVSEPDACVGPGEASKSVWIWGEFGEELAFFPNEQAFQHVVGIQRSVLLDGEGDVSAGPGHTVVAHLTVFSGRTGDVLHRSADGGGAPVEFVLRNAHGAVDADSVLMCAVQGSRIVGVMSANALFGTEVDGLDGEDPVVAVFDVEAVRVAATHEPDGSDATSVLQPFVAPEVDLSGRVPVVTIPGAAPPAELELTIIHEGNGPVVPPGARVMAEFMAVVWETGEVFGSSHDFGVPLEVSTDDVVTGFRKAIVGQRVGSTVLVVAPPFWAYGPRGAGHERSGQTIVFLVQISTLA